MTESRGTGTAEMKARASVPGTASAVLPPGRLSLHEELPETVAAAALPHVVDGDGAGRHAG